MASNPNLRPTSKISRLLRSNGVPTYHMASCADDVDLRISHIIRGQDHLTNTFKHVLIFEALGAKPPQFAHLPLLIAPDGSKLSKRKHGPVVSVLTYRDAGFLPHAYINFLCLLGWSPKDNREQMTRQELMDAFSFEGIHRHNAVVNFTDEDPIDPESDVAECRADPHLAGGGTCRQDAAVCLRGRIACRSRQDVARRSALAGAHEDLARRGHDGGLFLRRRIAALRSGRTDPAKGRQGHGAHGVAVRRARFWPKRTSATRVWKPRCAAARNGSK